MTDIIQKPNDGIYKFRGKEFQCDSITIQILNLALSMNNAKDRYEKIKR